jgi:hypothetical protein
MRGHTVPIETPQSMLEDPSNGSNTTTYLHYEKVFNIKNLHITLISKNPTI